MSESHGMQVVQRSAAWTREAEKSRAGIWQGERGVFTTLVTLGQQCKERDTHVIRYMSVEPWISTTTRVDQLWLWVLKNTHGAATTVISCFPDVERLKREDHPDWPRRTDVMHSIYRYMTDNPSDVKSANDLASLIVAKCSRVYLDKGSTLDFGGDCRSVLFSEIYEATICEFMQNEADSFTKFIEEDQNSLVEIKDETRWLWEIKDVLDELNTMTVLFNDQRRVIGLFESARNEADESESFPTIWRRRGRWRTGKNATKTILPVEMVDASIVGINGMTERAQKVYKSLNLVDLKLKHNDTKDSNDSLKLTADMARLAVKVDQQGRTVMTFTIVTIVFVRDDPLPLSLLATVFQFDIKQFKGNDAGKYELGYISAIIFPISITISALPIGIAFKSNTLETGLSKRWDALKETKAVKSTTKADAFTPRRRKPNQGRDAPQDIPLVDVERQ